MKTEHPIIFNAEMVRAILAGKKTQTRRVIKPQPFSWTDSVTYNKYTQEWSAHNYGKRMRFGALRTGTGKPVKCPYGFEGHTLWVRETCRAEWDFDEEIGVKFQAMRYLADSEKKIVFTKQRQVGYSADDRREEIEQWNKMRKKKKDGSIKNTPSIHMPRWASRIELVVDNVRVERVQDITASDALAEGVNWDHMKHATPIVTFQELWNSINEKRGYGWATNPWVWVVKFHMIEG